MQEINHNQLLLVFKGLPVVPSKSHKMKSISYSEFLGNKEYSTRKRIWLFIKNDDTYDGTYIEVNIGRHSRILNKMVEYLEANGYRTGKYDSIGEKRYQVIEGLIENKNPEYCEVHLETSRAEEVAEYIVNFLSEEKGKIHISTLN
jgi:hypothetical protein